jgi:hypothetical protein
MHSGYSSLRRSGWRTASGFGAVLALALMVAASPAEARRTSSSTLSAATTSAAVSVPGQATIPAGSRVIRTSSGRLRILSPTGATALTGFTCPGFLDCGFEFTETQTKVIMDAAAAGGVAAAVLACNAIPPASEAVCAVIGAIGGSVLLDLVGQFQSGKCLYLSLTGGTSKLNDC